MAAYYIALIIQQCPTKRMSRCSYVLKRQMPVLRQTLSNFKDGVYMGKIEIVKGDITQCKVDAIVNAANNSLLGGGGVDGAIHRAAGTELLEECRTLNGCMTGEAKITKGYNLPAKWVIHTVGPVWQGGTHKEDELLAACYRNSLFIAAKNDIRTIAFPSISTGAYRFPIARAAEIAVNEVNKFFCGSSSIDKVFFVCFDKNTFEVYSRIKL
jgi:O-acetyl-ADP-ribose deacetylase (regulator of RNase III)